MGGTGDESVTVLQVDDDPTVLATTAVRLEQERGDLTVETVRSGDAALARLGAADAIDCVVSDYQLAGLTGLELCETLRDRWPDLPFILFTGHGSEEIAAEAISAGVTDYLQKSGGAEQYTILANRVANAVAQRRAAAALERERDRHRALVRESTDVIVAVEPDGTVRSVSPAVEHVLGYDGATVAGDALLDLVHPADRHEVDQLLDALAAGADYTPSVEFRCKRADGAWIWLEARGRNLLDHDAVGRLVVYAREVTGRVRQHDRLRNYERIVETSGDGAFVVDDEGYFELVNRHLCERTGYEQRQLVDTHASLVLSADLIDQVTAAGAGTAGGALRVETALETRDGESVPVELRAAPVREADTSAGAVGIAREITDRKRRERELERQNERLERFATAVSHDLRNPLTVAQARTDMAGAGVDNEHLEVATRALQRMERLVDDLLALARDGRTVETPEPVDVGGVARRAWQAIPTASATLDVAVERTVEADRSRLRQLFENLFANAVEHGGDDVTVTVGATDGDGFFVADDGPGVDDVAPDRLFEPDYSTGEGGVGMGLVIVREIVQAHGWEITVADRAAGACFEVTVSTDPAQMVERPA